MNNRVLCYEIRNKVDSLKGIQNSRYVRRLNSLYKSKEVQCILLDELLLLLLDNDIYSVNDYIARFGLEDKESIIYIATALFVSKYTIARRISYAKKMVRLIDTDPLRRTDLSNEQVHAFMNNNWMIYR